MPIEYAGVELLIPPAAVVDWLEEQLNVKGLAEAEPCYGMGTVNDAVQRSWHGYLRSLPVRIGTLHWPTGARRHAVGHFLATTEQVNRIRKKVFSSTPKPATLFLSADREEDANKNEVATDLYLLPPAPLTLDRKLLGKVAKTSTFEQLFLLTLVDVRWYWRRRTLKDLVARVEPGFAEWADYYRHFRDTVQGLGTFEFDEPDAAFLRPSPALQMTNAEEAGAFMDLVAWNTGLRWVRQLDGSVGADNLETSKATLEENLKADWMDDAAAGGRYQLADHAHIIPAKFFLACRAVSPDRPLLTPFGGYVLSELKSVKGYEKLKGTETPLVLYDEFQLRADCQVLNFKAATALAKQVFSAWLDYLTGGVRLRVQGVVPWEPEGLSDCVEWTVREGEAFTLVKPGPFAEPLLTLAHSDGNELYDPRGEEAAFLVAADVYDFPTVDKLTHLEVVRRQVRLPPFSAAGRPERWQVGSVGGSDNVLNLNLVPPGWSFAAQGYYALPFALDVTVSAVRGPASVEPGQPDTDKVSGPLTPAQQKRLTPWPADAALGARGRVFLRSRLLDPGDTSPPVYVGWLHLKCGTFPKAMKIWLVPTSALTDGSLTREKWFVLLGNDGGIQQPAVTFLPVEGDAGQRVVGVETLFYGDGPNAFLAETYFFSPSGYAFKTDPDPTKPRAYSVCNGQVKLAFTAPPTCDPGVTPPGAGATATTGTDTTGTGTGTTATGTPATTPGGG
jgi:hypothetical protein